MNFSHFGEESLVVEPLNRDSAHFFFFFGKFLPETLPRFLGNIYCYQRSFLESFPKILTFKNCRFGQIYLNFWRLQNQNWLAIRLTNEQKVFWKNCMIFFSKCVKIRNRFKDPVGEILLWSINQFFYSDLYLYMYTIYKNFVHYMWWI